MSKSSASLSLGDRSPNQGLVAEMVVKLLDEAGRAMDSDSEATRPRFARAVSLLTSTSNGAAKTAVIGPIRGGLAPWQVLKIKAYVENHLDQLIRTDDLTAIARLSPSYFSAAFRRTFGLTPHNYLISRRIERAKTLMLTTDDSLSQIAVACGLYDQAHLSHLFRRATNLSPNVWRRQHREQPLTARAA